jgi:hypothetical protein
VDFFVGLWLIAMLIGVYFIPTIVAVERNVVNKWSVAVINAFLGWTLIGWVVGLAMALRTQTVPKETQGLPLTRDQGRYSAK